MDTTQLVIIISIVSVSLVIVICGIWLMFILKELRLALKKTNGIIDDTKALTTSLSRPISSLSEFLMGFKNGLHLFNSLFPKEKKDKS
ncbi:hypothetical protein KJ909_01425 [Patescibacteria group bacterium]|nr:hypothetical protein [Patescibacteria group bacterium]